MKPSQKLSFLYLFHVNNLTFGSPDTCLNEEFQPLEFNGVPASHYTELCFRDFLAHCHPIHRITQKPKTHFQDPIEHRTHSQIPRQNPKPPPTGANPNQIERPKNRRETAFEVFRPNHSRLSSFEHVKFSSEEGITSIKLEERCGV